MSQVQKLIHGGALRLMIIFLVTHCTVMRKNKKQVAAQGIHSKSYRCCSSEQT